MLNLPISGVESTIFLIYLGLWAGCLFGGFIFGTISDDETRRIPLLNRLLSSLTLVIAAWTWFPITQGTMVVTLAFWVAIGITLGFVGDVFMAGVFHRDDDVLFGMLSFGVGHIAYMIGMGVLLMLTAIPPLDLILTVLIWWSIALILWYAVVYRNSKPTFLIYAALPYAMLLATTVAIAMRLMLIDNAFSLMFIGAILFLVSDLILAAQLFNRAHFRYISDVVWFLYGPGQMLIVFSVILYTILNNWAIIPS